MRDQDDRAVPNASVMLYPSYVGGTSFRVQADAAGDYRASVVAGAHYQLVGEAPGYAPSAPGEVWIRQPTVRAPSLKLRSPGTLSITVVDELRAAVPGAELTVTRDDPYTDHSGLYPERRGHTDADGRLVLEHLPVGEGYSIAVRVEGFLERSFHGVAIRAPGTRLILPVSRGVTLRGTVLDRKGRAAAGAWLDVGCSGEGRLPQGLTHAEAVYTQAKCDEQGRFALEGLPPGGEAHIIVAEEGWTNEQSDGVDPGVPYPTYRPAQVLRATVRLPRSGVVEKVFRLQASGEIRGRLTDPLHILREGGYVVVLSPGDHDMAISRGWGFQYSDLVPGKYELAFCNDPYSHVIKIDLGPGQVVEVDWTPGPGVVAGAVVDAQGRPTDVPGIKVLVDGQQYAWDNMSPFRYAGLPRAVVDLVAEGPRGGHLRVDLRTRTVQEDLRLVVREGIFLKGRLFDQANQPVPSTRIELIDEDLGTRYTTQTSIHGYFELNRVESGSFRIRVADPTRRVVPESLTLLPNESRVVRLTLEPRE